MSRRTPDSAGLSLAEILGTLRRSFGWILVCGALATAGTYWWLEQEVQLYQGSALIRLIDARGALTSGVTAGDQTRPLGSEADPVRSEIMVLTGRRVLGEVVQAEGLRVYESATSTVPDWLRDVSVALDPNDGGVIDLRFAASGVGTTFTPRSGDAGPPVSAAIGDLVQLDGLAFRVTEVPALPDGPAVQLVVLTQDEAVDVATAWLSAEPRPGTDGVDVSYVSAVPRMARRVVNSVVQTYQGVNAASDQLQATRRREFLEEQLAEQDSLALAAQGALTAFRAGRQAYTSRESIQQEQAEAREIQNERTGLEAERGLLRDLIDALEAGNVGTGEMAAIGSTESLQSNTVVSQLYTRWAGYKATRDSMTVGANARAATNPDVQRFDTLIASTEQELAVALRSQLSMLQTRITLLEGRESASATALGVLPSDEAEEARLVRRVEAMQGMSDQLRGEYQRARVDEAVEGGQVEIVNLATRAFPVPRQSGFKLLLGALIGITLGSAIGLFREGLDHSLHDEDDVEAALGVPSLAIIPRIKSTKRFQAAVRAPALPNGNGKRRAKGKAVAARGKGTAALARPAAVVEAYRTLRTNLILAPSIESVRTLVVTSAAPGEGKTLTAANLGAAFAQQGFDVILIDADLRRPDLANLFGVAGSPGVTELLRGEARVSRAIHQTGVARMDVICSGEVSDDASELLGGRSLDGLIRRLKEDYDLVILDTPPCLATPDAAVLGAVSDAVLVVVRAGRTQKAAAEKVVEQLTTVGAHVIGAVLNDPEAVVPRYGGYYGYAYEAKKS